MGITRRDLAIGAGAAAVALQAAGARASVWDEGQVSHIIPAASHDQILIKLSLKSAYTDGVQLTVNGVRAEAQKIDTQGAYWRFRARGLKSGMLHRLALSHKSKALCEPWTLKTFPAPDVQPARFRFLAFTCAGGWEKAKGIKGQEAFRPLAIRQALIERGLSFNPDAVIANGDHIYWDQRAWLEHPHPEIRRLTKEAYDAFGYLDRTQLMVGTANEEIIKRIGGPQIAQLYGTRLRSTPSYFVNDDHDYFENDEANERMVTFPPDDFQVRAARAIQRLFYPEFLPDASRPAGLSGASAPDNGPGISECFGTLRFGRLFEAAIYDCGRFLSLKGDHAGLIPEDAEAWLLARTKAEETLHFLHVPSHPMGWTAGKWREWYPDVVAKPGAGETVTSTHGEGDKGRLTTAAAKFMWQKGWFAQHQRIVAALSGQQRRAAAMLSGDLHAIGHGRMTRSGELDLSGNPLSSILAGPISTSAGGWPSFARGTLPAPSGLITFDQKAPPLEKNGFTLIDVTPDAMTVRQFAWREPDPVSAIAALEPYETFSIPRKA